MIGQTMLFNPFTGAPRRPEDIASDPAGLLIWDVEEPLKAASPQPTPDLPPLPTFLDGGQWSDEEAAAIRAYAAPIAAERDRLLAERQELTQELGGAQQAIDVACEERDRHRDTVLMLTGQLQQARTHTDLMTVQHERDRLREEERLNTELMTVHERLQRERSRVDSGRAAQAETAALRTLNAELAVALREARRDLARIGDGGFVHIPQALAEIDTALAKVQAKVVYGPLVAIAPDARVGKPPCGECHLRAGETCDICGAKQP